MLVALVSFVWLPYARVDTPGGRLEGPGAAHLLGTDRLGRDLLTQLMIGARIALAVGLGAVAIGALLGVTLGLLAAFATRWLDDTLSAVLDILIAFPTLLLAMLIVAAQGASLGTAILAIGLAMSAVVARLTRVLAKRVLAQQYVTAARTSGTGWLGDRRPAHPAEHLADAQREPRAAVRRRRARRGEPVVPRPRRAAAERVVGPAAAGGAGHRVDRARRGDRPGRRARRARDRREPGRRRLRDVADPTRRRAR